MYASEIEISMPGFEKKEIGKKDIIYFQIKLEYKKNAWLLEKRFNDFVKLHKILTSKIGNVPPLPPKTFMRSKDKDFLTNRKCKLEIWLITLISRKDVFAIEEFIEFLEVFLLYFLIF